MRLRAQTAAAMALACGLLAGGAEAQFLPPPARAHETAQAFAQRIVALYAPKSRFWASKSPAADAAFNKRVNAAFYDPAFTRLMTDNGRLAGRWGGGPDLDYDPVCQCQDDPGGLVVQSVNERSGGFADIVMTSGAQEAPPERADYTIVLQHAPNGWRIYDVIEMTGAVRARLERHNACLREARSEAAAGRCLD